MTRILYISMCIPYDKVPHAGGKTFNYYINRIASQDDTDVTLIAKVLPEEKKFISDINPKIHTHLVAMPDRGLKKVLAYMKSINSKVNPRYPYGNTLTKEIYSQIEAELRKLKEDGYKPDAVILEWTSMLLFIGRVIPYFPDAVYIASEHDVTFLGKGRKAKGEKRPLQRRLKILAYQSMKKNELAAISKCHLVFTHNQKDRKLLIRNGVYKEKVDVIVPFFQPLQGVKQQKGARDIVFYGAMNRMENSSAALWFIDQVMPRLQDLDIRFVVVGNKPPKELTDRRSDRIVVTGFVEDVGDYFSHALCLAAPLLYGAGIKVKILEALTAGLVVLTNGIGIEGIDARDGQEYIHCESPEEYETAIRALVSGEIDAQRICDNARKMIRTHYDLEKSFENYWRQIKRGILGKALADE